MKIVTAQDAIASRQEFEAEALQLTADYARTRSSAQFEQTATADEFLAEAQKLGVDVSGMQLAEPKTAANTLDARNPAAEFEQKLDSGTRLRVLALAQEEGATFSQAFKRLFDMTVLRAERMNRRTHV